VHAFANIKTVGAINLLPVDKLILSIINELSYYAGLIRFAIFLGTRDVSLVCGEPFVKLSRDAYAVESPPRSDGKTVAVALFGANSSAWAPPSAACYSCLQSRLSEIARRMLPIDDF
jgi:hypothetical protein